MQILALETSAKAASAALLRDGVLAAESYQNDGQTHSVTLMCMAEDLLKNCGVEREDLDAIAVAAGPGSFTGVRIGVAAAKGLAWGLEKPCVGVSTLEAMVRGAAWADGIWVAAMDARRSQFYNAVFRMEQGSLTRLCEDRAVSAEDLSAHLNTLEGPKFLVGDGAALCYDRLKDTAGGLVLLPEQLRQQRAAGVALAAQAVLDAGYDLPAADLSPSYLRLSQAERERAERLAREKKAAESGRDM